MPDQSSIMVKQEPVNIKLQIIFTFIPILFIYAFYRIQKLRLFLCFAIPIFIASRFLDVITTNYARTQADIDGALNLGIFLAVLFIGLEIWLVHKWSKQWNEKFS